METPCEKRRKTFHNLFTSSAKIFGNDFFNSNTMSNYNYNCENKENIFLQSNQSYNNNPFTQNRNFSFSKIMQTSTCKKTKTSLNTSEMIGKKKLRFSECRKIYYDPDEELDLHSTTNQVNQMNGMNEIEENADIIKDSTPKEKEILRLNVKSSKFKISNVNFDINFCYMNMK